MYLRVYFVPSSSLSAMVNSIDAYVIGFSVLSFYVLKKYLKARRVWKRYG